MREPLATGTRPARGVTRATLLLLAALALASGSTQAAPTARAEATGVAQADAGTELHRHAGACDTDALRAALGTPAYRGMTAEIDRRDRDGMTALAVAARAGCLPSVISLAQAGADVDIVDAATGWTPLHHAASQRHAAVVDFLLAHGARQDRKTLRGESALGLALVGTSTAFGPKGDLHTTEMVLSSGRSRAKYVPAPRVATTPKKPAAKKSSTGKTPPKQPAKQPPDAR